MSVVCGLREKVLQVILRLPKSSHNSAQLTKPNFAFGPNKLSGAEGNHWRAGGNGTSVDSSMTLVALSSSSFVAIFFFFLTFLRPGPEVCDKLFVLS